MRTRPVADFENDVPRKSPASASIVPEPLIDSERAAAIIGIHPKTLQKMARSGEIKAVM